MNITIKTVKHTDQPYPTVGMWRYDADGNLIVEVSELSDWRRELLVAIHELVEAAQCKRRGVSEQEVTDFDLLFEREQAAGQHSATAEPGDDERAPYREAHFHATNIERQLSALLDVDWNDYDFEVANL